MDATLVEIISVQTKEGLAYHVIKLIMWLGPTWSMQKMGRAVIHSENIRVAHSFRRNATMLTHYNFYLVVNEIRNFSLSFLLHLLSVPKLAAGCCIVQ